MQRFIRPLRTAAFVLLVLGLLPLFWPQSLGGQVAYVMVSGTSMQPGMQDGDLAIVRRHADYEVGQVVAFRIPEGEAGAGSLVIHRIVALDTGEGFTLRGDNSNRPDLWRPAASDVAGSVWVHVPGAGKAVAAVRAPLPLALGSGAVIFLLVLFPSRPRARRDDPTPSPAEAPAT